MRAKPDEHDHENDERDCHPEFGFIELFEHHPILCAMSTNGGELASPSAVGACL
jgi:hypothetical protein